MVAVLLQVFKFNHVMNQNALKNYLITSQLSLDNCFHVDWVLACYLAITRVHYEDDYNKHVFLPHENIIYWNMDV